MGYVTLKKVNQFIPPNQIVKSAGTWTPTVAGNLVVEMRTAAAGGFYLVIPITLFGSELSQGARVKSIDIWYKVGTAAMAGMASVTVKKLELNANAVNVGSAEYSAITLDADHDTEAERKAVATHKMTVSFTGKPFLNNDEALQVVLSCEAAATSAFTLYGAQANFELRL
jgi:hypothetical protein